MNSRKIRSKEIRDGPQGKEGKEENGEEVQVRSCEKVADEEKDAQGCAKKGKACRQENGASDEKEGPPQRCAQGRAGTCRSRTRRRAERRVDADLNSIPALNLIARRHPKGGERFDTLGVFGIEARARRTIQIQHSNEAYALE